MASILQQLVGGDVFHLYTEQIEQQAIAVAQVVVAAAVDGVLRQGQATQLQLRGYRCGLSHVVGLDGARGDQYVGAPGLRIGGRAAVSMGASWWRRLLTLGGRRLGSQAQAEDYFGYKKIINNYFME